MKNFAMAHAMKKRSMKMAKGGEFSEEEASGYSKFKVPPAKQEDYSEKEKMIMEGDMDEYEPMHEEEYADGGMVDRVMKYRGGKMYSKGGQVANDVGVVEADKLPAEYDDLVLRDDDMEDADYTGANSGDEIGNEGEDERRSDIISRIMKSRAKKDRNPRPA